MKRIQKRRRGKQQRRIFKYFEVFVRLVQGLGTASGFGIRRLCARSGTDPADTLGTDPADTLKILEKNGVVLGGLRVGSSTPRRAENLSKKQKAATL